MLMLPIYNVFIVLKETMTQKNTRPKPGIKSTVLL